jgi:hypothetical protein
MKGTTDPSTSDFLPLSRGQWDKNSDKAGIEAAIDKFSAYRHTNETPES